MKLKQDLKGLSNEKLNELLEKKENLYTEVEEEMNFVLGQTGLHLPGGTKEKYENQLSKIKEEIKEIKKILTNKD